MTATGHGTQRRIRAVMARGWTPEKIAEAAGIEPGEVRAALERQARISEDLAASVADAYERIWDAPAPARSDEERQAADEMRARGRRCGWPVPMAWDDIDADAQPAEGWRRSGRHTTPSAAMAEDDQWIREQGGYQRASVAERAMRLGVKRDTLEQALTRTRNAQRVPERELEAG